MHKAVVFIDGQNLRYSLREIQLEEKDVDWTKFLQFICPRDHLLIRAYWYQAARIAPWNWESKFSRYAAKANMTPADFRAAAENYYESEISRLRYMHDQIYERIEQDHDCIQFRYAGALRLYPTFVSKDMVTQQMRVGQRDGEKGVDVALAVDMVRLAPLYDTAILVTGDYDLTPAVQAVKDQLRRVITVRFVKGHPPYSQRHANRLMSLCDMLLDIPEDDMKDPAKFGRMSIAPAGAPTTPAPAQPSVVPPP